MSSSDKPIFISNPENLIIIMKYVNFINLNICINFWKSESNKLYFLLIDLYYWALKSILDFPGGSDGKASVYNVGDLGSIPGLGRSPGEGKGYPLQYSDLENCMHYSPWGHKESDTTERLSLSLIYIRTYNFYIQYLQS